MTSPSKKASLNWIRDHVNSMKEKALSIGFDEGIVTQIMNNFTRSCISWGLSGEDCIKTYEGSPCDGPICVKDTRTCGLGIFATRDIMKGETITHYPIDTICMKRKDKEGIHVSSCPNPGLFDLVDPDIVWDELSFLIAFCPDDPVQMDKVNNMNEYLSEMSDYGYCRDKLRNDIGHLQFYASPNRLHDPYYLGHLFNDGGFHPLKKGYNDHKNNVEIDDTLTIKAMKKIKKGDQCLLSYGEPYWWAPIGETTLDGGRGHELRLAAMKNRRNKKRSRSNKNR